MANKKFLLIVEGEVTEPSIFKAIFEKYGFTVFVGPQMPLNGFNKEIYISNGAEITICQGARNRIGEMLKQYKSESTDLQKIFKECSESYSGIFIIYDVDHTSNEDLGEFFNIFQDETEGLLLVSSPCIEIMAEINRDEELKCEHLTEYKTKQNIKFQQNKHMSTKDYIINNFDKLVIEVLDKNVKDLKSSNIMEHPQLIIENINNHNIRFNEEDNKYVIYRYFTTVIYVAVAYILGLTKEIDNADNVKKFFQKNINDKD